MATYGYTMIRGYQLTLSDLALPSHRASALAAILAGAPSQASDNPQTAQQKADLATQKTATTQAQNHGARTLTKGL